MNVRYKIIEGSETGHCCFESTIVDTHRFNEVPEGSLASKLPPKPVIVAEVFNLSDAELIVDALNESDWRDRIGA